MTRRFSPEQFSHALESWEWLGLSGKVPVLASAFGDVFLAAADGYWFLDSLDGSLVRCWRDLSELEAELTTAEGQAHYLLAGLAGIASETGLSPGDDEVYDFVRPPVLGGEFSIENLTTADFVVALNVAGRMLGRLCGLLPGTPVGEVRILTS